MRSHLCRAISKVLGFAISPLRAVYVLTIRCPLGKEPLVIDPNESIHQDILNKPKVTWGSTGRVTLPLWRGMGHSSDMKGSSIKYLSRRGLDKLGSDPNTT